MCQPVIPLKQGIVWRWTYVATGEVTALKHELGDDTVEAGALVVEGLAGAAGALLAGAERAEVLGGLFDGCQPAARSIGGCGDEDSDGGVLALGTWSAKSSMTILPAGEPPMVISKKTRGFDILMDLGCGRQRVVLECCLLREMVEGGAMEGQLKSEKTWRGNTRPAFYSSFRIAGGSCTKQLLGIRHTMWGRLRNWPLAALNCPESSSFGKVKLDRAVLGGVHGGVIAPSALSTPQRTEGLAGFPSSSLWFFQGPICRIDELPCFCGGC